LKTAERSRCGRDSENDGNKSESEYEHSDETDSHHDTPSVLRALRGI
jgi:hypothetical protein